MYQLPRLSSDCIIDRSSRDETRMNLRQGWLAVSIVFLAAGCGGGGAAVSSSGTAISGTDCTGSCFNGSTYLTTADVETVIAQAVAEAQARRVSATIAVVDRVGNVLAVYRMGAVPQVLISSSVDASNNPLLHTGLDGIRLPTPVPPAGSSALQFVLSKAHIDDQAAIAKAVTGAYLSSEGNAFSTRTASQIIQEHFNVGELNQPSGPLFGVQFSSLACSDFIYPSASPPTSAGPHSTPLGLSADPGGFPLYKSGTPVGGVGVISDGLYSLDKSIAVTDPNLNDEAIAYAGSYSYAAPVDRRADQITANGVTLRFSDVDATGLLSSPMSATPFADLGAVGSLIKVTGYADGVVHAGTAYGQPASGVTADPGGVFPGQQAFVFVDANDVPRYPPIAGMDGSNALTRAEVVQILSSALATSANARAQIRLPLGLPAQVTISVVDTLGNVLGMVRSPDAPIFGADVSLQKARTAAFFSSSAAGDLLQNLPQVFYLNTDANGYPISSQLFQAPITLAGYASAAQSFLSLPSVLTNGGIAFSDRAIGNLSRPFFPDGIDGAPNGPFSKPYSLWSIFSTGLQLDLANNSILEHVLYVATDGGVPDASPGCIGEAQATQGSHAVTGSQLANGLQIFPGSVPIYRGPIVVGAVGVSGDGVDQDDMIAFLGLQRAIKALGGSLSQAPPTIRADTLAPKGTRLQYVQCPQAPFINSTQENVCAGF
jgi:uncharacterized protein GlcG (DUF336 family)